MNGYVAALGKLRAAIIEAGMLVNAVQRGGQPHRSIQQQDFISRKRSQNQGQRGVDGGFRAADGHGLRRRGTHRRGEGFRLRVMGQGERFCEYAADGHGGDADDVEVHVVVLDRAHGVVAETDPCRDQVNAPRRQLVPRAIRPFDRCARYLVPVKAPIPAADVARIPRRIDPHALRGEDADKEMIVQVVTAVTVDERLAHSGKRYNKSGRKHSRKDNRVA